MTKKTTKRPAKKRATVENVVTVEELNEVIRELEAVKRRVADIERAELLRRASPTVSDNFSRQIPVN